jgi:solute carrier family 25 citrate transporter 1
LFHGIYKICADHGIGGIYKGCLATVMKQSSNQGIRFVVYEESSKKISKYVPYKILSDLLAGAFAGFCSTMANNPVDVVKTKM